MGELNYLRQIKELRKSIAEHGTSTRLAAILAKLDSVHLKSQAGYLLRNIKLEEIKQGDGGFKSIKIAIISNFVCDEISNFLRTACLSDQIYADIYCADFNQYMWQLLDNQSELYQFAPDITLCLLDEHIFLDILPIDWTVSDYLQCMDEVLQNITQGFSRFFENSAGLLVTNTVVLGQASQQVIIDYRSRMELCRKFRTFNDQLYGFFLERKGDFVIDTEILLQQQGVALKQLNMSAFAKKHFSDELLAGFAEECKQIAQSLLGKTKKCLVLDCDNTLWGGIIGDDGLNGIVLGASAEGEIYTRFQASIRQLRKQGVILAINSKNNRENTDQVFSSHPDIVLKPEDFAFQCVNWEPKHENIKTIAGHLNISCEHIVFVDDSDFECNMVRELLPMVSVVKLSGRPEEYIQQLSAPGFFTTRELTAEDVSRSEKYRAESERKVQQAKYSDVNSYLHSLNIQVDIRTADEFSLSRVAQLSQRTNQFNLTTERLTERDVSNLNVNSQFHILTVSVEDKFGSSGLVGAAFVHEPHSGIFHIRNLLLSCRVFSRGIETALLSSVISLAADRGGKVIYGYFSETDKNHKFVDFYEKHGFIADGVIEGNASMFRFKLVELDGQAMRAQIPWIEFTNNTCEIEG